jgi:hypothetical protein
MFGINLIKKQRFTALIVLPVASFKTLFQSHLKYPCGFLGMGFYFLFLHNAGAKGRREKEEGRMLRKPISIRFSRIFDSKEPRRIWPILRWRNKNIFYCAENASQKV